ncbi:hypothetical protein CIHG_02492 [Coccidioides immitis H538.4]|uniref:Uncharacterized protein n=3 Tax=Coccidioides immitis TaxID=5501 RepID=A0A0J8R232_COCIT|nr:hypothetical protein CIRG_02825 [Coccidioides immitis RMSCC 2394]KMU79209.1 hypothetical protein CISG_07640 [Coccidioides immitis RMSCC 3703]KMU84708.1 hypothetical protein CIHG_02492 [Coccidioides immitis H538.4]
MSATVSGLAQAWRSPQFRQRQAEPHPPCHRRQADARQHGQSSSGGSRGLLGDSHIIPNNIAASMMPDQVAEQDSSSQTSSQKGRSASCGQTVGIPASVIAPANGLQSLANPSSAWISTEKAWYLPTETFPLSILSRMEIFWINSSHRGHRCVSRNYIGPAKTLKSGPCTYPGRAGKLKGRCCVSELFQALVPSHERKALLYPQFSD